MVYSDSIVSLWLCNVSVFLYIRIFAFYHPFYVFDVTMLWMDIRRKKKLCKSNTTYKCSRCYIQIGIFNFFVSIWEINNNFTKRKKKGIGVELERYTLPLCQPIRSLFDNFFLAGIANPFRASRDQNHSLISSLFYSSGSVWLLLGWSDKLYFY